MTCTECVLYQGRENSNGFPTLRWKKVFVYRQRLSPSFWFPTKICGNTLTEKRSSISDRGSGT